MLTMKMYIVRSGVVKTKTTQNSLYLDLTNTSVIVPFRNPPLKNLKDVFFFVYLNFKFEMRVLM